jgi:maleate isomerase
MSETAIPAAQSLAMAQVSLLVFACTSGSFILGRGWDQKISDGIVQSTGIPTVTTSTAMIEALLILKAKKIGLATPYSEEITQREVDFLEHYGFEVVSSSCLRIVESSEIAAVPLDRVADLARAALSPKAEALFISCTNLHTMQLLDALEEELGIPVISSNQATLWWSLRNTGHKRPLKCAGSLLRNKLFW